MRKKEYSPGRLHHIWPKWLNMELHRNFEVISEKAVADAENSLRRRFLEKLALSTALDQLRALTEAKRRLGQLFQVKIAPKENSITLAESC